MMGYAIALATFTPIKYNPLTGKTSYYQNITVRITLKKDAKSAAALQLLCSEAHLRQQVTSFVQNPEMIKKYPVKTYMRDKYQLLIVTPKEFHESFKDLVEMTKEDYFVCERKDISVITF